MPRPSRLTPINQALEAGKAVTLSAREAQVIGEVMNVARRSDYLFDPASGKLVARWGCHTELNPHLKQSWRKCPVIDRQKKAAPQGRNDSIYT